MLAWTIYISFLGALLLALIPGNRPGAARASALTVALGGLVFGLLGWSQFAGGEFHTIVDRAWIPTLGIRYVLAADGISITLVLLTGIAATAGVLFSWNVERRPNHFYALYFALIGGVYGVFLSFDVFLFFVFYEIAIIPKYFLIAIWGSTRKEYGAMKLALYSFAGSAMVLVALIAAYVIAGANTTVLADLARHEFPRNFQLWAFPLAFVGFAVLAGLWPFHTWAPTGHVAAPTAASMLLAGVVMKLGAYGCLRLAMVLFPAGLEPWGCSVLGLHSWRDVFAVLALVGIVYGATVAMVQRDFKFVIGYSSVSHMGFVLLGLMALNVNGLSGAVLQMFSHGIIAGLLFAVVGRLVYDRAHTRDFAELGPLGLNRALPFASITFIVAAIASMGMPGFSGFVAELQVLVGTWQAYPKLALLTGFGIVLGVAYTLRALQKAFFANEEVSHEIPRANSVPFAKITWPERAGVMLLVGTSVLIGLYPRLLLDLITPSLRSSLFERLLGGGLGG